jgi:hypothetical protein
LSRKNHEEEMAKGKMMTCWKIYLSTLIIFLAAWALFCTTNLLQFINLEDWTMTLFLGALLLFTYWLLFVILRVRSTERPTFSGAAMEEDAYIIYSVNQWTGVENSVIVPYDTLVQVLIGVWTNPSFKGIHSDYPGTKCISLYTDDDGLPAYSTSFTHDEAILELWVSRLRKNNVPLYVTGRNITMATTAHYEELFRTIKAVPYDGTRMFREFLEEQEDQSFWWPTNKGRKK